MTRTYKVLISLALAAVLLAGGLALLKKSSGQRAPSAAPAVVQAPAGAQPPESVRSEMAGEPAPWELAQEDVSSTSARTSALLPKVPLASTFQLAAPPMARKAVSRLLYSVEKVPMLTR